MDLGATVCRPRNPACPDCPLSADCAAARSGDAEAYPRRAAAKARPIRRGAAYFAFRGDGAFLARRRPPKGPARRDARTARAAVADAGGGRRASCAAVRRALAAPAGEVEQVFTHFALRLTVYAAAVDATPGERRGALLGRARTTPRAPAFRASC